MIDVSMDVSLDDAFMSPRVGPHRHGEGPCRCFPKRRVKRMSPSTARFKRRHNTAAEHQKRQAIMASAVKRIAEEIDRRIYADLYASMTKGGPA